MNFLLKGQYQISAGQIACADLIQTIFGAEKCGGYQRMELVKGQPDNDKNVKKQI